MQSGPEPGPNPFTHRRGHGVAVAVDLISGRAPHDPRALVPWPEIDVKAAPTPDLVGEHHPEVAVLKGQVGQRGLPLRRDQRRGVPGSDRPEGIQQRVQ